MSLNSIQSNHSGRLFHKINFAIKFASMKTLMLDLDHAAFLTPGGTGKEKHSSHQGPFLRKRFKPFYLRAIHQQDMRYLPNQKHQTEKN